MADLRETRYHLPGRLYDATQVLWMFHRYLFGAELAARHARVLEIGCGAGVGLGLLSKAAPFLVAGDHSDRALRVARTTYGGRSGIHLVRFDAHALPFRDAAFDLILAFIVLDYVDSDVMLRECRRVLGPAGTFAFAAGGNTWGLSGSALSAALRSLLVRNGFTGELFGAFPHAGSAPHGASLIRRAAGSSRLISRMRAPLGVLLRRVAPHRYLRLDRELTDRNTALARGISRTRLRPDEDGAVYDVLYGVAQPQRAV